MQHEAELFFFRDVLINSHIPCHIMDVSRGAITYLKEPEPADEAYDLGLRALVEPDLNYTRLFLRLCRHHAADTVYRVQDPFFCRYFFFRLPDEQDVYVLVGPFTEDEVTRQDIMHMAERHGLPPSLVGRFEKIFRIIPIVRDSSPLLALLTTLGERLWGETERFSLQDVFDYSFPRLEPVAIRPGDREPDDGYQSMKALEKLYESENALMRAVSHGETHISERLLGALPQAHLERRAVNNLRDLKNYAIIANTLMRKAAEYGHVHPVHIDNLSSRFARSIESAASNEEIYRLVREMGRKYCLLVKNYSLGGYSSLVRKVLVRINSDLTADLSLKTQAVHLHVSASYLSSVFKKETGTSLTEYVNRKRVEYGVFLLNSTDLQIQTIAQHCGIPDLNYFSRIFKKYMGMTPSDYRGTIHSLQDETP